MLEKVSCAERIRRGLTIREMSQKDLCDATGIPKSAMSQYCKGSFVPKQNRTALIAKALNVDEAWLMGYDVPMEKEEPAPENESGHRLPAGYDKLTPENRAIVDRLIADLANNQSKH